MDRKQIAYELISRSRSDINSFLHNDFIYPCVLYGIDSFTDEELERFMKLSEHRNNDYRIIIPTLTNVQVTVNTNKSIEEVKADLIECNHNLLKFFSKHEIEYRPSNKSYYTHYGDKKFVSIADINDSDIDEITYEI